ncbi:MAG: YihA family ribosome biogenesis GTP-binding protein [Bacteroidaceae bacterium]|nr:YihA family ribosome biogenesis GTP-binding protein [Bacteroidaceae bacterium]
MQIKTAEFVISSARVDQCPQSSFPEYAFIGRSNVGKSSLINMLTNHSKLAKTSATPGKTLLINHFLVNKQWYLVDLPGYGFARRSKTETENLRKMITGYILMREQMANLFLLIDSRHKPQKNDLDFIEFLGNNEVPFSIVFTKADKLSRSSLNLNVKRYLQVLEEQWEVLPPYFVTSAESKLGKEDILDYIEKINATLQNE